VVDRRIELAQKYAAIEGGSTAAAYTAVVAATIGSHGGASPLTLPAAASTFAIDLGYISLLQLRLAYDISVLYGKPLDYEDPEDLYDLLVLAFGVKAGETFSDALQRLSPEVVRVLIKKTITGPRLQWFQAIPVVGRFLLQRNLIKMAIPVVGIPVSAGINYFYTGAIGKRARLMFRLRGAIEEAADQIQMDSPEFSALLLQTIWLVAKADEKATQEETWFLRYLIAALEDLGDVETIKAFEEKINFDAAAIISQLKELPAKARAEVYEAACVASIVDGKASKQELSLLRDLAGVCDCEFDERRLSKLADELRGE
jgi:uncharacterized protein (DUF697 family)